MTYRLDMSMTLEANVRAIVAEQLERSIAQLSGGTSKKTAVHETRKSLKRIRALLKLVRPAIGEDLFRSENKRFRDIAAQLSTTRDHDILTDALQTLECFNDEKPTPALRRARACVEKFHTNQGRKSAAAIRKAKTDLQTALEACQSLTCGAHSDDCLEIGLAACYRKARKAQRKAYQSDDDEAFHDWRKPIQVHWRQMSLFWSAWPAEFEARIALAKELSQNLGQDHDLKILINFLNTHVASGDLKAKDVRSVERLARACQQHLRKTSRPFGQILFQEPAQAHARRIVGIWSSAARLHRTANPKATQTRAKRASRRRAPATTDAS